MFKYILESAGNINWMAIASLITFLTIFMVGSFLVFKKDSSQLDHMARLPLDDDYQTTKTEKDTNYEK